MNKHDHNIMKNQAADSDHCCRDTRSNIKVDDAVNIQYVNHWSVVESAKCLCHF